jgi:hypothetical protein
MASPFDDDDWMPSAADVESLALERSVRPNETDEDLAERLIREAAPKAAMKIVHIATSPATQDRVALDASKYILERACGKVGDSRSNASNPWDEVFATAVTTIENHANGAEEA